MEHGYIVLFCNFLLFLGVLYLDFGYFGLELVLPGFLELFLAHEGLVFLEAGIDGKHRRVSISILEVDFPHVPFKVGLIELGEVVGYDLEEGFSDLFELAEIVIAIELEGAVHDTTVVEGCNC